MLKMCNRAVSRAVQGEGEEKRVSMGEKTLSGCRGDGFQPCPASKCSTRERLRERP